MAIKALLQCSAVIEKKCSNSGCEHSKEHFESPILLGGESVCFATMCKGMPAQCVPVPQHASWEV